jgi:hypothetical protein
MSEANCSVGSREKIEELLERQQAMIFFLVDLLARSNATLELLLEAMERSDGGEGWRKFKRLYMEPARAELTKIKAEFIVEMLDPENAQLQERN